MLDYALLSALAAVLREGSFERAAAVLHVTPSAVSQRIKLLEERLGQVLVVRGQPCTGTEAGLRLARHAEQVAMLEHTLHDELPSLTDAATPATLRVAVNADSLATWFITAAAAFAQATGALLDVSLDDQDHTAERLRAGEVLAAVTTLALPVQGCRSLPLGRMRYLATASPAFMQRWFADGVSAAALAQAPSLTFNQKDRLQALWIEQALGQPVLTPRHWLPASQAFVDATCAGLGWGMNPASLVAPLLANGQLVQLLPAQPLFVALCWQHARRAPPLLTALTDAVRAAARLVLEDET